MNNTPQLENGFVGINNENAEQFAKLHLSGNEWQVLWVVLRKTWGWQKKDDAISLTQFQKHTNLSRPSIKEAIDKMVGKKVLVVSKDGYINKYSFNKLYNQWIVPKKELVGFSVKDSTFIGKKLVPKKEHTINTTKDTNTTNSTLVEKITLWAYKRARVNPSCNEQSFRTSVLSAIQRLGEGRVKRMFEVEDNAIQFLRNIKAV